jgi:hypothetical protein
VLLDRVEVAPLVGRLGHDPPPSRLAELSTLQEVVTQIDGGVGRYELGRVLDVALGERVTFRDQVTDLFDESSHPVRILRVAFDQQIVSLRADADVQQPFEVSQVVVVGPEERGEAVLADGDTSCGSSSDRDISLCYKELTDQSRVAPRAAQGQGAVLRRL